MKSIDLNEQQLKQMKTYPGFIAALDQSGGSTPEALRHYGIKKGAWSNEDEMLRSCIRCAPASLPVPASGTSRGGLPPTIFGT